MQREYTVFIRSANSNGDRQMNLTNSQLNNHGAVIRQEKPRHKYDQHTWVCRIYSEDGSHLSAPKGFFKTEELARDEAHSALKKIGAI